MNRVSTYRGGGRLKEPGPSGCAYCSRSKAGRISIARRGGTPALTALGDPLPDLILVDYNLPGMRGDEFCRRIRMNLSTRGAPAA